MVWPHLKILWHVEENSAGKTDGSKKEKKAKEATGRQYQGMDKFFVWRHAQGSGKGGVVLL